MELFLFMSTLLVFQLSYSFGCRNLELKFNTGLFDLTFLYNKTFVFDEKISEETLILNFFSNASMCSGEFFPVILEEHDGTCKGLGSLEQCAIDLLEEKDVTSGLILRFSSVISNESFYERKTIVTLECDLNEKLKIEYNGFFGKNGTLLYTFSLKSEHACFIYNYEWSKWAVSIVTYLSTGVILASSLVCAFIIMVFGGILIDISIFKTASARVSQEEEEEEEEEGNDIDENMEDEEKEEEGEGNEEEVRVDERSKVHKAEFNDDEKKLHRFILTFISLSCIMLSLLPILTIVFWPMTVLVPFLLLFSLSFYYSRVVRWENKPKDSFFTGICKRRSAEDCDENRFLPHRSSCCFRTCFCASAIRDCCNFPCSGCRGKRIDCNCGVFFSNFIRRLDRKVLQALRPVRVVLENFMMATMFCFTCFRTDFREANYIFEYFDKKTDDNPEEKIDFLIEKYETVVRRYHFNAIIEMNPQYNRTEAVIENRLSPDKKVIWLKSVLNLCFLLALRDSEGDITKALSELDFVLSIKGIPSSFYALALVKKGYCIEKNERKGEDHLVHLEECPECGEDTSLYPNRYEEEDEDGEPELQELVCDECSIDFWDVGGPIVRCEKKCKDVCFLCDKKVELDHRISVLYNVEDPPLESILKILNKESLEARGDTLEAIFKWKAIVLKNNASLEEESKVLEHFPVINSVGDVLKSFLREINPFMDPKKLAEDEAEEALDILNGALDSLCQLCGKVNESITSTWEKFSLLAGTIRHFNSIIVLLMSRFFYLFVVHEFHRALKLVGKALALNDRDFSFSKYSKADLQLMKAMAHYYNDEVEKAVDLFKFVKSAKDGGHRFILESWFWLLSGYLLNCEEGEWSAEDGELVLETENGGGEEKTDEKVAVHDVELEDLSEDCDEKKGEEEEVCEKSDLNEQEKQESESEGENEPGSEEDYSDSSMIDEYEGIERTPKINNEDFDLPPEEDVVMDVNFGYSLFFCWHTLCWGRISNKEKISDNVFWVLCRNLFLLGSIVLRKKLLYYTVYSLFFTYSEFGIVPLVACILIDFFVTYFFFVICCFTCLLSNLKIMVRFEVLYESLFVKVLSVMGTVIVTAVAISTYTSRNFLRLEFAEDYFDFFKLIVTGLYQMWILSKEYLSYDGPMSADYSYNIHIIPDINLGLGLMDYFNVDPGELLGGILDVLPYIRTSTDVAFKQDSQKYSHMDWDAVSDFSTEEISALREMFLNKRLVQRGDYNRYIELFFSNFSFTTYLTYFLHIIVFCVIYLFYIPLVLVISPLLFIWAKIIKGVAFAKFFKSDVIPFPIKVYDTIIFVARDKKHYTKELFTTLKKQDIIDSFGEENYGLSQRVLK